METTLDQAKRIVYGERNEAYGDPQINHDRTAAGWRWYIKAKYGVDVSVSLTLHVPLNAADVCDMHIIEKMSRDMQMRSRDNQVDKSGYAENVAIIEGYDPTPSEVRGDGNGRR